LGCLFVVDLLLRYVVTCSRIGDCSLLFVPVVFTLYVVIQLVYSGVVELHLIVLVKFVVVGICCCCYCCYCCIVDVTLCCCYIIVVVTVVVAVVGDCSCIVVVRC